MARKLRMESEGGIFHVINRGNYRGDIFRTERAKAAFLKCLGEACGKVGWRVHAWCIMTNHYHLAVETPHANLVEGMQWLQGTFSTRFNRLRKESGHLFQGRYKSLPVDPAEGLGGLCHYIHLNPVRAKLRPLAALADWPWSSYHWLMQPKKRPAWYAAQVLLERAGGLQDTAAGRRKYAEYLAWLSQDEPAQKALRFAEMSSGWAVGSPAFKKALVQEHKQVAASVKQLSTGMAEAREAAWNEQLEALLKRLRKTRDAVEAEGKSVDWKRALAAEMKCRTTVTNRWLGEHLRMGSMYEVSRKVSAWQQQPDPALMQRLA